MADLHFVIFGIWFVVGMFMTFVAFRWQSAIMCWFVAIFMILLWLPVDKLIAGAEPAETQTKQNYNNVTKIVTTNVTQVWQELKYDVTPSLKILATIFAGTMALLGFYYMRNA